MTPPESLVALREIDATWVEQWRALRFTPLLYRELRAGAGTSRVRPRGGSLSGKPYRSGRPGDVFRHHSPLAALTKGRGYREH